jgi:hypothetical protein
MKYEYKQKPPETNRGFLFITITERDTQQMIHAVQ